jgi:AcrR family transcriptional regulator
MSPRPRKVTDQEVFAAALRVIRRVGPADLTLAAIADEAGVTPGALVQRFGSKKGLQVAMAEAVSAQAGGLLRELRAKHSSPLAALRAYADCMAELAASPAAVVRNIAYLQSDLADPALYRRLLRQARATRAGLQKLIEAAQAAGELVARADARRLARAVETVLSGSLLTWAIYREGRATRWLRADLDAALSPYIVRPGRRRARAR